jgi:AraC-like DNA-binding protein
MREAEVLLRETFLTVKEIRALVGVRDESHFMRNFKKSFKLTPMQYRRMCQAFPGKNEARYHSE